jgi:D-alanyl-D-alanine carboxypeptidase/D-alanyl-D-alanine-endopeptidase (penicillin-binding protein 4)
MCLRNLLPALIPLICVANLRTQQTPTLEQRIQTVVSRPEFSHARFGLEFYSLDRKAPVYKLNEQELFVPGSTTKLLTEGTALELLGSNYRFHTRVYGIGALKGDTLDGDIVLVASGDPNLSNRIQQDDTLAFENEDHSYGGPDSKGLPGERLAVFRELAEKVVARGVRKITGSIFVDNSLFPEGERELGTGVIVSPIVVNDNVIDVIVSPGPAEGAPARFEIAPEIGYIKIINQVVTGPKGGESELTYSKDSAQPDGTWLVTLSGSIGLGERPRMVAYHVPAPTQFAAFVLRKALNNAGVTMPPGYYPDPDFKTLAKKYAPNNLLAEHISPPLKEEVKVTLKVSQNLHASMTPFLLGALLKHSTDDASQAGFDLERDFLSRSGLDLTGAVQSDGAGGAAFFTPDFMVHYLLFMSKQTNFTDFYGGLPILGRDGTLFNIQVNSPAAGHVHAKTGTYTTYDALNRKILVTGKGLTGYMETQSGEHLILALYVNNVSVSREDPDAVKNVGDALGAIATAAYLAASQNP